MEGREEPSSGNAVVPMDAAGEVVDEAEFRRLLRFMSDGGTNVFVGGPHATEFVNMEADERRRLWEVAVDEIAGRDDQDRGVVAAIPLGPGSTTAMIKWFRLAKSMGFDAAQLYPGAQDGRGWDGLFVSEAERYFRDVLEAVELPMYLCGYHGGEIIDSPTKQVPFEMLTKLTEEYPHVVGVTVDGRAGPARLAELVKALGPKTPVRLAGALDWFEMMELGIYGFHSIQQSIAPRLCSTMMSAFHSGDAVWARQLSQKIRQLNEIVHTPAYAYPRSIKPVLEHLGFRMGSIRRPYLPLADEHNREIARRLDRLHLEEIEDLP